MLSSLIRATRRAKLAKSIGLLPTEDLDHVAARALPTIAAVRPNAKIVVERYYGFNGHDAELQITIGNSIDKTSERVGMIRLAVEVRLQEALRMMRREALSPDDFSSWKMNEFFTMERGLRAHLDPGLAGRTCTAIRYKDAEFPNVAALCAKNGVMLSRYIPGLGTQTVRALEAMLQTAGLSLTPRNP